MTERHRINKKPRRQHPRNGILWMPKSHRETETPSSCKGVKPNGLPSNKQLKDAPLPLNLVLGRSAEEDFGTSPEHRFRISPTILKSSRTGRHQAGRINHCTNLADDCIKTRRVEFSNRVARLLSA